MSESGIFITLEGIEGCGKTTQSLALKDFLESKDCKVTHTQEPGWGVLGKYTRKMLLDEKELRLEPFAELCLFCADRAQHVRGLIKPSLEEGHTVVCDRFSDSTVAYQGYGRGLNLDLVEKMAWAAALGVIPDLTIILDLPAEAGLERIKDRGGTTKIDEESIEFHTRVREGFYKIAESEPKRVVVVGADKPIDELAAEIAPIVMKRVG
ncbi:MAG: dTMP kinase [Candidatus Dadabacteria bacterium]|nr:dTMP kinase [Candidatus Dadabacteria bacterium]